ncbi:SRPBCC family protein [Luteipulveratus halotolerans]|uniref:SRPBCC family protein n=1 Tax=Luteipulveratus halotolerans TaxID=1631356 RepID=UPI000680EF0B|nr:SRPBCC family protein [Luteipulveratus halotolerans]
MPVQIVRTSPVAAERLWEVFVDWPRHGAYVPLSRLEVTGRPGVGQVVDAITRLGPLEVHDTMRVDIWQPPSRERPGVALLTKTGRVLSGFGRLEITATGAGSRVQWDEDVRPRPAWLGRLTAPVATVPTRMLFARVVDGLVREAEQSR